MTEDELAEFKKGDHVRVDWVDRDLYPLPWCHKSAEGYVKYDPPAIFVIQNGDTLRSWFPQIIERVVRL